MPGGAPIKGVIVKMPTNKKRSSKRCLMEIGLTWSVTIAAAPTKNTSTTPNLATKTPFFGFTKQF